MYGKNCITQDDLAHPLGVCPNPVIERAQPPRTFRPDPMRVSVFDPKRTSLIRKALLDSVR